MTIKYSAGMIFLSTALMSSPALADAPGQPSAAKASSAEQPAAEQATTGQAAAEQATPERAARGEQIKPGDGSASDVDRISLHYLKGYVSDTGKLLASPLHWDGEDWVTLGLVVGVTSSMFLIDESVNNFARRNQNTVGSGFAEMGNALGNPLYILPPIGAFYLYGYLADDRRARRAALLAVESYAVSAVLTSGLKILADRHRPNTGDGPTTWDGPRFSLSNLSFSSAHTAAAFSIATVFADEYKDNAYVAPVAYGLATLTGLSRIYSNEHWSSDVFFGAAIGYFTSKALLSYHKEDKNKFLTRLTVLPEISTRMTGLALKFDF